MGWRSQIWTPHFQTNDLAIGKSEAKLREIIEILERVYCQSIGYEYMHVFKRLKSVGSKIISSQITAISNLTKIKIRNSRASNSG